MRDKDQINQEFNRWPKSATADKDLMPELESMSSETITDAFYRDLVFGNGGLRGTI